MSARRRKKGDVEWFPLDEVSKQEEMAGVEVGLKHIGPGVHRRWLTKMAAIHQQDKLRMVKQRAGMTREQAPELFPPEPEGGDIVVATAEGYEELLDYGKEILFQIIVGIKGWEDLPDHTECKTDEKKHAVIEELDRIGMIDHLMRPAREMQALKRQQFLVSEGDGGVRTGGSAADPDVGSGNGVVDGDAGGGDGLPVRRDVRSRRRQGV